MNASYDDITNLIAQKPQWWTLDGVPRYCQFQPNHCSNVYADEVALLEIACQGCGERFFVEVYFSDVERILGGGAKQSMSARIEDYNEEPSEWSPVHYGDPPRHDCVGDAMNVCDLRVVEFWQRQYVPSFDWVRIEKCEIQLEVLSS